MNKNNNAPLPSRITWARGSGRAPAFTFMGFGAARGAGFRENQREVPVQIRKS